MANGIIDLQPRAKTWLETLRSITDPKLGISFAPDMDAARAREADYSAYLGQTDYDKQLQDAQDMTRLQLGLALASRGFASMGAQPRKGEMAISTLGRELLAPLGADAMTVAQQLYQQKKDISQAKRQEDRQLKLAALQAVTAEEAAARSLATELMPQGVSNKLLAEPYWVIKKGEGDRWEFVTGEGGGNVQVRLQEAGGEPYNVNTLALRTPLPGEMIVTTADLGNYGLSKDETGGYQTSKTEQILITPALQELIKTHYDITIPDDLLGKETTMESYLPKGGEDHLPKYNVLNIAGNILDTRFDQNNKAIPPQALADAITLWEDPKATRVATIDSQEAKQNFAGFMAGLGGMQRNMGLGQTGLRFVAANRNFELDPDAELFPFVRVDGAPLTRQEKINLATDLRTGHLRLTDRIKAGETRADLDEEYAQEILGRYRSITDWGLTPVDRAAGVEIPREQITQPAAITALYKASAPRFQTDPVAADTIQDLPLPVGNTLRTGVARVVLYNELGVNFGEGTTSPPSYTGQADTITLEERQRQVAASNRSDIQTRLLAEQLSKGTSLSTVLTPALTDTRDEQLRAVATALDRKQEDLSKILADGSNREFIQDLAVQLNAIKTIDRVGVIANRSGVQGFIFGPLESALFKNFGLEPGAWFRDEGGQEAARELIAQMPILDELVSRQLLEIVREARKSNADLRGMQKVIPRLGQSEDYNAEKLRQLRKFLVGNVQAQLESIGTYDPPDALLVQAAGLGFDLKGIKGQNNYYNPYLADSNYPVTNQRVPRYSREAQQEIRNQGILNYVARGLPGQAIQYELLTVDAKGLPIWDTGAKKYRTGLYDAAALALPANQKIVDFNVNRLKNQFKIDN